LRTLHDQRRDLYFYAEATDERLKAAVEEFEPLEEPTVPASHDLPEQEIRAIVRDEIQQYRGEKDT
jgi:hypothetical protein